MAMSDYLAALRRELRSAEQLGKETAGEIRAEIVRVERLLGALPVERAVSGPVERAVTARGRK